MNSLPTWDTFSARWPNAAASRFVDAAGLRWHVQVSGTGPTVVVLHGSGAANHSWRDVTPLLAAHCTVIAPDLPGHGFTGFPPADKLSLRAMADSVRELLRTLDVRPDVLVGHSAGGALALWLAAEWPDCAVVGVNAALAPPNALMTLLTPAVGTLAGTGIVGFLTARLAESDFVFNSLMRSTGSIILPEQMALYRAFAKSERHATALMSMFAEWNLPALAERLPAVTNRVTLIVGAKDEWVPVASTEQVAKRLTNVELIRLPNSGHLAHEEEPNRVTEIIMRSLPPR
ncbi:MAG: alpha/beta fold hydrolase [Phycisphaerae bacterium]|nr:alpha/beta fold hydrolase [Gemmatimonadaceae bacterium]